jgi:hypothetical protein
MTTGAEGLELGGTTSGIGPGDGSGRASFFNGSFTAFLVNIGGFLTGARGLSLLDGGFTAFLVNTGGFLTGARGLSDAGTDGSGPGTIGTGF